MDTSGSHTDHDPNPSVLKSPTGRRSRSPWFLAAVALLVTACAIPAAVAQMPASSAISAPVVAPLVTADPNAAPTPTPFLPQEPDAEPIALATSEPQVGPSDGPPWGSYPGPSLNPGMPIPPPVGLLPQPPGQVNILILGSDQRPFDGGFRTDTILLVTVNPAEGRASITSFPRDLYIYIPGWTMQRINTAHARGGFPTTALTFEYNFGVRPDHFVLVNFWAFEEVVDNLGGIDVNVARPHSDHRDRYGRYNVPAGVVHMDAATALWYVRSRYSTNDFDRTRRQQEVLIATFYRLLSLDAISRAPELFEIYRQNFTTDIEFADIKPLLPLARIVGDTQNIHSYFIGPAQVTSWVTPGGAQVLLPNRDAVLQVMREALSSPPAGEASGN